MMIPDPLSYAELRRLEIMLWRYRAMLQSDETPLAEALHRVTVEVARRAGRAQAAVVRTCAWCGKEHTDRPPDLCDACFRKTPAEVARNGEAR